MTSEHDSATTATTSLLGNGEVCRAQARQSRRDITDAPGMSVGVVGGSRSAKEDACKSRRSAWVNLLTSVGCQAEVRAAIRAKKWGNSHGAKGGRKAKVR